MSYATEASAIRSRFYAQWKAAKSYTKAQMAARVAWPNKRFQPPDGLSWVRLEIQPAAAEQTTMGTAGVATYWYDGTITVQVFTPAGQGDGPARTLAEQVCAVFRNVEAEGIIYDTPYVTTAGEDDSGWYQLNVWAPYRRRA